MNTGATFDNYTGFMLPGHFQDSTIIRKIIFGLNEKDCERLHVAKTENLTIPHLLSISLKTKMIKSVVRFKWLHFCSTVTRTLKILIYNLFNQYFTMKNIKHTAKLNFIVNTQILTILILFNFFFC